ncbi:MAG TPA: ROK family protein [Gemmatimonadaceae bacterium]|jgi:fructokinase
MKRTLRIGIDLGGTKIEALALDAKGTELVRQRVPTPPGYEESLEAIRNLVADVERKAKRTGTVGIGIPGIVVPETGLVKNANSVWLNGQPLKRDLEERLARPVRLMNDADCFALSEAVDGAAAGAGVVFGVIIGTGVGGGIVVDGKCLPGANLIAGEWGHNPLPWMDAHEYPGPSCYCGRTGCIEMWVSGPGFERDHARRTGTILSAAEIVRAAAAGDSVAAMSLSLYCDRLGRSLASLVNVLDPDVIVLGGGMSNVPSLPERVAEVVPKFILAAGATSSTIATRFVCAKHGDSSGVRGAARLWDR